MGKTIQLLSKEITFEGIKLEANFKWCGDGCQGACATGLKAERLDER